MALKCEEKGKISRVQKCAIFAILTSRVDVEGYLRQFHFLTTSEKLLGLDFKPFGQNPTFCLKMCEKYKITRVQNFMIFNILTLRVDVAEYLGQFYFLTTSEKSLGLDFKPLGQNPTFGLKM
jgi:hypothetical protein